MVVRRWIFFTQKLSSFHTIFLGARKKIISKLVYTRSSHCNGYSLLSVVLKWHSYSWVDANTWIKFRVDLSVHLNILYGLVYLYSIAKGSSDENSVTNFFLSSKRVLYQTGKWQIWSFLGLKRVCQRGIWDYERKNYILRCALLE